MSWINYYKALYDGRGTVANNSITITPKGLGTLLSHYDNIFDFAVPALTGVMSSIRIYPFKIPIDKDELDARIHLEIVDRIFTDVEARFIDIKKLKYMNLGEVYIERHFNNFLDYKGYTYINVFIPFLGLVEVDVNECIGKYLQFRLSVDIYTGQALYIIGVSDTSLSHTDNKYPTAEEDASMRIISTFENQLGINIPFGNSNEGDIQRNILLGTIKSAGSVYTGIALSSIPSQRWTRSQSTSFIKERGTEKGSRLKTTKEFTDIDTSYSEQYNPYRTVEYNHEAFDNSLNVLSNIRPTGQCDRIAGSNMFDITSNYIKVIIYRPRAYDIWNDTNYKKLFGLPLNDFKKLSELSGFTKIGQVRIEGENFEKATTTEIQMLYEALTNGIIL